jgi:hypothetical protein
MSIVELPHTQITHENGQNEYFENNLKQTDENEKGVAWVQCIGALDQLRCCHVSSALCTGPKLFPKI